MRRRGKYQKVDPNHPRAFGVCDISGWLVNHDDLVKQMEYVGNALVWTGLLVHPAFLDKPNPQGLAPLVISDPTPVKNARPYINNN
jgi:hypothetical protein